MSLISNSKATFDYEILERYEAGVKLLGYEVKSLKAKHGDLQGSYVLIKSNADGSRASVTLKNCLIPPYQENNTPKDYDPRRDRELLLNMSEIAQLVKIEGTKGLTIIPISMYNKGNTIKIELAVARSKKKFDKRRSIEKRETDRNIRREFKDR